MKAAAAQMTPNRRDFFASASSVGIAIAQEHEQSSTATRVEFRRYDPALPPRAASDVVNIHMRTREAQVCIREGIVVPAWTFEGDVPGPIIHVRQGDTVNFTLTNEAMMPHSMDFHCALVDPGTAFRSVQKGQSVSFTFKPRHAGAYLYHCGTQPILMHIGYGMYGAIIVDPLTPLPPAKEFVLVQSEFYLDEPKDGVAAFNYNKMLSELPGVVAFNGRPGQYMREPIRVKRGDRVRFYVVSAGPTHQCFFHVVGQQFESVYLGAPPDNAIHGVQTFGVPPGGGVVFEFTAELPGSFPFVNHGFGHGQKGAAGLLIVEA